MRQSCALGRWTVKAERRGGHTWSIVACPRGGPGACQPPRRISKHPASGECRVLIFSAFWCPERDLNPQGLRRRILSRGERDCRRRLEKDTLIKSVAWLFWGSITFSPFLPGSVPPVPHAPQTKNPPRGRVGHRRVCLHALSRAAPPVRSFPSRATLAPCPRHCGPSRSSPRSHRG